MYSNVYVCTYVYICLQVLACFVQVTPANSLHSTSSSSTSLAEGIHDLLSDSHWLDGTEVEVQHIRARLQETAVLTRAPDTVWHANTLKQTSCKHPLYTCTLHTAHAHCSPMVCSHVWYTVHVHIRIPVYYFICTGCCEGSCGKGSLSGRVVWAQEWPWEVGCKVSPCLSA